MRRGELVAAPPSREYRVTSQYLAPGKHTPSPAGGYDIYPSHNIGDGKIDCGLEALATRLGREQTIIIDGYIGVFWEEFKEQLDLVFQKRGVSVCWQAIGGALHPEKKIEKMIEPYMGGDDPIFGRRYPGYLVDFFDPAGLKNIQPASGFDLNIVYGPGAALSGWRGILVYLDVPKNEIQFRSRAGMIYNLGATQPATPKQMYKRFYFIDWVMLNRFKAELCPKIDVFVDAQRPEEPLFTSGEALRGHCTRSGDRPSACGPGSSQVPGVGNGSKVRSPS